MLKSLNRVDKKRQNKVRNKKTILFLKRNLNKLKKLKKIKVK